MVNHDRLNLASDYLEKAYKLHLEGNISEAIDNYIISIDIFPTAKAHTFLGWAYSMQGKYVDAIEECYLAIDLDPHYGNPYNDIGSYLISLNRYDEAISWLEKAIKAENYEMKHYPYINLGRIMERIGEWFKALEYYKKALEIKPDYDLAKTMIIRITSMLN